MRNLTDEEWVEEYYKEAERLCGMAKIVLKTFDYYERKALVKEYIEEYTAWAFRFAGKSPSPYGLNGLGRKYREKHYGNNYHYPEPYSAKHFMTTEERRAFWHEYRCLCKNL